MAYLCPLAASEWFFKAIVQAVNYLALTLVEVVVDMLAPKLSLSQCTLQPLL